MTQLALPLTSLRRSWITQAKPVVVNYAATHGAFTSDDVRPLLTEPEEPNWVGAVFAGLKSEGHIERVGYQTSTRPERNGSVLAVWKRKEGGAG